MVLRKICYELLIRRPRRHARQTAQPDIAHGLLREGDVGWVTMRIGHYAGQRIEAGLCNFDTAMPGW